VTEADTKRAENHPATHPDQAAMQDEDINQRLEENPDDPDAKLDAGLDQSMDASDPPATVQPGDDGEPVPSSGYDEAAEEELRTS
jgi:hypothetical protein